MGITANVKSDQIVASVGETKIDVTVSGGVGPTGPAGPAGASSWNDITGKPTFAAVATSGAYSDLIGAPAAYTLPTATASVLGGVKIGSGISIDGSGVISASSAYTLPTATASVLGGVKIGSGVTITDGVISVSTNYAASSHTHSLADITDAGTAAASDVGDFAPASDFDQGLKTIDAVSFDSVTVANPSTFAAQVYTGGVYAYEEGANPAGSRSILTFEGVIYPDDSLQTTAFLGTIDWADVTNQPTLFDGAYSSLTGVPSTFTPSAHNQAWSTITSTPTTLAGYGITDAAAASHSHAASAIDSGTLDIARIPTGTTSTTVCIGNDARLSDARTPTAHNQAWSTITSTPTTRSGYGITDAQKTITSGTAAPTGGSDGDIYLQYT